MNDEQRIEIEPGHIRWQGKGFVLEHFLEAYDAEGGDRTKLRVLIDGLVAYPPESNE